MKILSNLVLTNEQLNSIKGGKGPTLDKAIKIVAATKTASTTNPSSAILKILGHELPTAKG